ncbi:hypothetical protein KKE06_03750 [Candidatus Micrarchaeota archaeon]|nr:hypothetical protein [Candidatus Micrarchaeota archaeon]MBU1930362.1 hypothetical protein [Candidatus Micrarchaeota archaeon]
MKKQHSSRLEWILVAVLILWWIQAIFSVYPSFQENATSMPDEATDLEKNMPTPTENHDLLEARIQVEPPKTQYARVLFQS